MIEASKRGLSLMELLELRHLPDDGLIFEEVLKAQWIDRQVQIEGMSCEEGPTARLEVQPLGPIDSRPPILIRGVVRAGMRSTCVRCLSQMVLSMSIDIEQTLFRDREEEELIEHDGSYDEAGVDLPNLLREAVLLDLSMHPTCQDEPACDKRTQALIDQANESHSLQADPRWAGLQALVDQKN